MACVARVVSKLVRGDVADACIGGDTAQGIRDTELGDGSAVLEEEPVAS
jgi:hypothetical protein